MEPSRVKRATITVNGLDLFYRDTGGDGRPILCLHGKWGRGETWTGLMSRYRDGYRIIAPDQRGHGLSGRPVARYAGEDFAGDAYELIMRLGLGPAIVVGHSIGGRNAAYLAALYPDAVKALVILDSRAGGPKDLSTLPPEEVSPVDSFTAGWPLPYTSREEAVADLGRRFPRETNVRYFLESLTETAEGYDFMFSRYAMSAIDVYYQGWYHVLGRIKCPVLLVRAGESWYLSEGEAGRMREHMADCEYFEVTGSDHMVYMDNPDGFYLQFGRFIGGRS